MTLIIPSTIMTQRTTYQQNQWASPPEERNYATSTTSTTSTNRIIPRGFPNRFFPPFLPPSPPLPSQKYRQLIKNANSLTLSKRTTSWWFRICTIREQQHHPSLPICHPFSSVSTLGPGSGSDLKTLMPKSSALSGQSINLIPIFVQLQSVKWKFPPP